MNKHTPGPWGCVYTSNHAHDYRLTKPNGSVLPLNVEANDHSEQRTNAQLMAASPDMLYALKRAEGAVALLCEGQDPANECWVVLGIVRQAIAKAEGRSERNPKTSTPHNGDGRCCTSFRSSGS
jgi:hypothetical protein